MELTLNVKPEKFTRMYITMFQGFLKLTERECQIAAYMIELNYNIPVTMDKGVKSKIDEQIRDYCNVREQDFANYKQKLKKKKFLMTNKEGDVFINPRVYNGDKMVSFKFNF